MKAKIISFITILILSSFSATNAEGLSIRGRKSVGVKTGYVTLNRAATAGVEMQYAFSNHFVLAPSIDYVFRNDNLDGLLFNLDYHGSWQVDKNARWYFYHILGFNYVSWSSHSKSEPEAGNQNASKDVTTRFNRLGLDFGAGLEYYVSPTLKLSLQGKFNWLKQHNTGVFNLGISYVF